MQKKEERTVNVRYRTKGKYFNGVLYDLLEAYCPTCSSTVSFKLPGTCKACDTNLLPNTEIKRRGLM